jgi:hypothetical protein
MWHDDLAPRAGRIYLSLHPGDYLMKTIYSMGRGKYITLDSYDESHGTRRWSVCIALFSITIATISATALFGVDITQVNPQPTKEQINATR